MDDPSPRTPRPPLQHVALIGVDHPGDARLAEAWRAARAGLTVTGLGAPETLDAAEAAGTIDRKAASLAAAVDGADLVVLLARLPTALRHLGELAPHLAGDGGGPLVTDTGAVKQPIARHAAEVLPDGVPFVGGHLLPAPEAGGEDAGQDEGRLFAGGTYFLCPSGDAPDLEALRAEHPGFVALAEDTGARVQVLSAARHDRLCATARDLPALLSAALAEVISDEGHHEVLHALMPPAHRSLVWGRAAPSAERREEVAGNEGALLDALGRYARVLQQTRRRLAAGDLDAALGAAPETSDDE